MTKQKLKDYRYTCKCIKQLESELNDAAVTDSTQGSQSEYPYVKHSVTISGVPDTDTHLDKKRRLSELKAQKAEVERFIDGIPDEQSWKKVEKQRYIAAAMRHFEAYRKGEFIDAESGMPHLWHCACNLMFLIELDSRAEKQTFSDGYELDNEVKCGYCKYHSTKTQHCIRKAEITDNKYSCGMGVLRK